MALSYVPADRAQQFLLPPDMRDWLPEDHLAWFVLEVVARLDTAALHARHRNDGVGRRAYDPDMLLALLVYAYCTGQRSSRQIERLCQLDVAYRIISANQAPDHSTIARFRQGHEEAARQLFVDVLAICAEAGLATVGVVAVDGTKMAANASRRANRTRAQIEAEVAAMFAQAQATDAEEDRRFGQRRGDELPSELADPRRRAARLDAALAAIEAAEAAKRAEADAARARHEAKGAGGRWPDDEAVARAEATLEATRAKAKAKREAVEAAAEAKGDRRGLARRHPEGVRVAEAEARLARAKARAAARAERDDAAPTERQANVTDPDSRLMISPSGWVQGYNAQAAVNAGGVILAAEVSTEHNDLNQCTPMMAATQENLAAAGIDEAVGTMLFDAGYCSEDNLVAPGPDRLIATAKSWKLRAAAKADGYAQGDPPADASPLQAMEHRLRTERGAALYGMRQHIVEPVFGHTKFNRGYDRFVRRGRSAADAEWKLIATAHNIAKLFAARTTPPPLST